MTHGNFARWLGLVILVGFLASCVLHPILPKTEYADLPGLKPGDDPDQVVKVLGQPQSRANGWWEDELRFDMKFRVWYYKGVGRVIFAPATMDTMEVHATEKDPREDGKP